MYDPEIAILGIVLFLLGFAGFVGASAYLAVRRIIVRTWGEQDEKGGAG